jgi:hypothetical protein
MTFHTDKSLLKVQKCINFDPVLGLDQYTSPGIPRGIQYLYHASEQN